MPHDRFFSSHSFSIDVPEITIDDSDEVYHIRTVMKCREGDQIELIDGKGSLAQVEIIELPKDPKKKQCKFRLLALKKAPKQAIFLSIALAMTRQNHMEFALEKCTEIGASQFLLFPSEYSERDSFSEGRKERYRHIIRSAMKQSGQLFEPSCLFVPTLKELIQKAPLPHFFADLSENAQCANSAVEELTKIMGKPIQEATLFIGPEKGWSQEEKNMMSKMALQKTLSLSKYILRTETAAIIGCHDLISALHSRYDQCAFRDR